MSDGRYKLVVMGGKHYIEDTQTQDFVCVKDPDAISEIEKFIETQTKKQDKLLARITEEELSP